MPELLIRYKSGIVPGEYIERQIKRAPDIASRVLKIDVSEICVESRKFEGIVVGYADEEVGLTARSKAILQAAKTLELQQSSLPALRIEERHSQTDLAGKWVGRAILQEWIFDPESDLYRLPLDQASHETVVTVYPSDFAYISSKELQGTAQ